MDYLPIPDAAARQFIDSITVFEEYQRTRKQAAQYAGGMYWKTQGAYEYLVKTQRDNSQERIGPRNAQTEAIYQEFTTRKSSLEDRLRTLRTALTDAQRLNKALKVGRTPAMVIDILQALEDAGLADHFTVVGTHSLYAYESAAGVRIVQGALATQDVDLLWDARRRVRFITEMERSEVSMLKVLQRADATFQRKEGQNETAINAKGFEVDLWPVQAVRASVLTNAPPFQHVVASATGHMAMMRTISPATFVDFKRWMAEKAPAREPLKRNRDRRQADIVQGLLDQGLLIP
jgi:hypothetical protein